MRQHILDRIAVMTPLQPRPCLERGAEPVAGEIRLEPLDQGPDGVRADGSPSGGTDKMAVKITSLSGWPGAMPRRASTRASRR
jgi:hypothetical protein